MKHHSMTLWKGSTSLVAVALLLSIPTGCEFGGSSSPGVGIQNVTQAAPKLSEFNENGLYDPYYATGDLGRPRYFHMGAVAQSGFAIVFGGTDERGFSGIDTVELYDQSTWEKDSPRPESVAGIWIDTNFDGDPITFDNGPRLLFTVDSLADGRLICIGGAADLLAGPIVKKAEIFDPESRTFETIEEDMVLPRFRQASIKMNDGGLLLIAGQIQTTVTIINEDIPQGFVGNQQQITVFITTPLSEVFSPTESTFRELTLPGTEKPSKLNSPRGRAGHDVERIAGPDDTLRSADDIFVVAGGFQALSAQFAPRNKQPGAVAQGTADGLLPIEFFDPLTQVFTQVSNVQLGAPRINDPHIMNLGWFNDFTPDGVKGMGNVILITHGNVDAGCPVTPLIDELLVANYTGFGPAQGLQFFNVGESLSFSHIQGLEYYDLSPLLLCARSATNPVPLPRRMITVPGVNDIMTWIITTAGVYVPGCPPGPIYGDGHETMRAGCVFDPFFNLVAFGLGLSPRDLTSTRSRNNPTGVVGTWLTLDGAIPTVDLTLYGTTQVSRWAKAVGGRRVYHKNIPVAGEDGIMNTPDDRILLAGGGIDLLGIGGEPTTPSAEILLPPGVNDKSASP